MNSPPDKQTARELIARYVRETSDPALCPRPLVSVILSTFKHASFLRQAFDSILMQNVDFDFEILVTDDCSNDGTEEIVAEYQARHPDKVRYFAARENLWSQCSDVACPMGLVLLENARGSYIAGLEGDDYWTDPEKLRLQTESLEAHPEVAVCFHDAEVIYEDGRASHLFGLNANREFFTLSDLMHGNFIASASAMFRRQYVARLPEWWLRMPAGDWGLYIICAAQGAIRRLPRRMSAYRIHPNGWWTSGTHGISEAEAGIVPLERLVEAYRVVRGVVAGRNRRMLDKNRAEYIWDLSNRYLNQGRLDDARAAFRAALSTGCFSNPFGLRNSARLAFACVLPRLHARWRKRRRAKSTAST